MFWKNKQPCQVCERLKAENEYLKGLLERFMIQVIPPLEPPEDEPKDQRGRDVRQEGDEIVLTETYGQP